MSEVDFIEVYIRGEESTKPIRIYSNEYARFFKAKKNNK